VALDHFPGHFGVHGVGIIQQRRMEEGKAGVEQDPKSGYCEDDLLLCSDGGLRSRMVNFTALRKKREGWITRSSV
jgi:hypothetical protein